MNSKELYLKAYNLLQYVNQSTEAYITFLMLIALFPNTKEARYAQRQIDNLIRNNMITEKQFVELKEKAQERIVELKEQSKESTLSSDEIHNLDESAKKWDEPVESDNGYSSTHDLGPYESSVLTLLSLIVLIMLYQTFGGSSYYTVCVTPIHGDPNPAMYCEGNFQGKATVSEMYDNGWKLITNVGTSQQTWLFEK